MLGRQLFVDPDLGVASDALKLQPEPLAHGLRLDDEALAVVKAGGGHIPFVGAVGGVGVAGLFGGVVVGQVGLFPALQYAHHQRVLQVAFQVFPVFIQIIAFHGGFLSVMPLPGCGRFD